MSDRIPSETVDKFKKEKKLLPDDILQMYFAFLEDLQDWQRFLKVFENLGNL